MSGPAPEDSALHAERERRLAERARRRLAPRAARRARRRARRALAAAALAGVVAMAVVAFTAIRARGGYRLPSAPSTGAAASSGATDGAARVAPTLVVGPIVSGAAARRAVIPILMYHVIGAPPAGTPYPQLWVAPATFRAQMYALARAGYHGVTLTQAFAAWRLGAPLPKRPVVISFDDGYRSQSTAAAPVLRKLGWPGVLNLEINNVGPDGISLSRLRGLVRDGWEIDSHTVDHRDLTTLGHAALRDELVHSRAWIGRWLGIDTAFFCYPAGRFDTTVVAAVHAAGYRGATTELPGLATARDDPYRLPRVRVMGGQSAGSLRAALTSDRARGRALRPPAAPPSADH